MKSISKFSTVTFAAFLCFASCAFAQDTAHGKTTGVGSGVLNYAPSAVLTLTLDFGNKGNNGNNGNNGGKGCTSNQGGRNGWDWGWGGGGNNGGGCTTVPEGGTTLTYLSLAGLCCLGAVVFRRRQQSSLLETRN
jgi:hypothetical protein